MSTTQRPLLIFQGPFTTRSGYGDHSRDLIESLIKLDKFDIKLVPTNWGTTPMNVLKGDSDYDKQFIERIMTTPPNRKPDVFIQCTVPNEFQPLGNYNIGITAGMETTAVSKPWVDGCNRMDLIIVPSEHSKRAFVETKYEERDNQSGRIMSVVTVTKPIEILFEGIDTHIFNKTQEILPAVNDVMDQVKEDFALLYVGHWLSGDLGHDRKDVGMLIKTFLETYRGMETKPALVLKTSFATFSVTDRQRVLDKIQAIKKIVGGDDLPNVYLVHGEMTREELNSLYNHPKIKGMVSFTKGEGFGRPLLEFAASGKPIVVSGWSGHTDFISRAVHTYLEGELKQVHQSSVWKDVIIPESGWFYVNYEKASKVLKDFFTKYKEFKYKALNSENDVARHWSLDKMTVKFGEILDKYKVGSVVAQPQPIQTNLSLPKMVKVG